MARALADLSSALDTRIGTACVDIRPSPKTDVLVSVSNSVCFSSMSVSQAAQRRTGLPNRGTSDVAENVGGYLSCTERTAQRNNFELISTLKMETRHRVEGSFGSEFRVICNHCVVIAA